ncbi:MAG: hypothetical protein ACE5H4_12600 [Candidatus Thorarchaeota archaeon]
MTQPRLPWSFYAVIVSFGVFFFSLNVYILTILLQHPLRSDLWIIGIVGGFLGLIYSVSMTRVHQRERILAKEEGHA